MSMHHCASCICEGRDIFAGVRLSVVIPVYNEKETILTLIDRVRRIQIPKELVICDDRSSDGTTEILRRMADNPLPVDQYNTGIRILFHERNHGKGAALRTALKHITGNVVIIQDADLEYDPREYYKIIEPIVTDKADVVYGSRFISGGAHRVLFFWHYIGNKFITLLSNMFTNLNLSDIETCYKAFRKDVLDGIRIEQNGFGFEVEFTSKIAHRNCRIYEVGISYYGRTYDEGKKITWKDGLRALYLILKYH